MRKLYEMYAEKLLPDSGESKENTARRIANELENAYDDGYRARGEDIADAICNFLKVRNTETKND